MKQLSTYKRLSSKLLLPFTASLPLLLVGGAIAAAPSGNMFAGATWALLGGPAAADLKATGSPNNQSLHVTVKKPAKLYYTIQLTHDVAAAVPANASLHFQFWARSATKNTIHAVVEQRSKPYTHVFDQQVTLTPDWKQYSYVVKVPAAYGPKGLAARLQLGLDKGTMDFKGMTLSKG